MSKSAGFLSVLRVMVEGSSWLGRLRTWMCGTAAVAAGLIAGCGGGGMGSSSGNGGPVPGESTLTTVVVTSAANDQLIRFGLILNSLTLTTKSGTSVPVISAPQPMEFMHLNGGAEPLLTVEVPQGVYTAATATVGYASFTCLVQQSGSDTISTYAYGATPNDDVTVQLPEPLTVSGDTMALSLDLLVPQSASLPSTCWNSSDTNPYSITPTFSLASITLAAQPSSATNGKMIALEGLVLNPAAGANSFTISAADGTQPNTPLNTVWQVSSNSSTVFQGIGNVQGLAAGMPVDIDGDLQANGSLVVTRLAVPDTDTTNLTVNIGPLMQVAASEPVLNQGNQMAEGSQQLVRTWPEYDFSNTTFAVWGGLTNLASLPFAASFSGANMVAGQMVAITTHVTSVTEAPETVPGAPRATVMTLMPQTINGTVVGIGTSGAFTTYTVQLSAYDVFPQFAVQAGQTTLLQNPQQVVVYADSNAQLLSAPTIGNPARFTGVIFNDNGMLRMDSVQVAAGVAE